MPSTMNKQILIAACALLCMLACPAMGQEAQLEKAFTAISQLSGFQTFTRQQMIDLLDLGEDSPMVAEEMGDVVMTAYGNADPREQFLATLEMIPRGMIYRETIDERHVIRFYTETSALGVGYLMWTFVGMGSADTVAILYKGRDEGFYKAIVDSDPRRFY